MMKNIYAKWFSLSFLSVFLFVLSVSARTVDKVDDFLKSEMQKNETVFKIGSISNPITPLENIGNTKTIKAVVMSGKYKAKSDLADIELK